MYIRMETGGGTGFPGANNANIYTDKERESGGKGGGSQKGGVAEAHWETQELMTVCMHAYLSPTVIKKYLGWLWSI